MGRREANNAEEPNPPVESSPPEPSTVKVTFNVFAATVEDEHIHVTGSLKELANWAPQSAPTLNCGQTYPVWTATVDLPPSCTFHYKYIRKYIGPPDPLGFLGFVLGTAKPPPLQWERDPNRSFTTPASGSCTINDIW
ncbi:hypothetical protein FRC01_011824, partial [Tulasnella sp. 417]